MHALAEVALERDRVIARSNGLVAGGSCATPIFDRYAAVGLSSAATTAVRRRGGSAG
jgi:hypothetical protein